MICFCSNLFVKICNNTLTSLSIKLTTLVCIFKHFRCFFQDYIAVKEKNAKYLPHSGGRYAAKRFRKAQCPIVERLTNSLMMHGRNNGKKLMAVRIVKHAFEIMHLLTGENPLQVSLLHYLLT